MVVIITVGRRHHKRGVIGLHLEWQFAEVMVVISFATISFVLRGDGLLCLNKLTCVVDRPNNVLISALLFIGRALAVLRDSRQNMRLRFRGFIQVLDQLRLPVLAVSFTA